MAVYSVYPLDLPLIRHLSVGSRQVEVPLMTWIYPIKGLVGKPESATVKTAQEDVKKALKELVFA